MRELFTVSALRDHFRARCPPSGGRGGGALGGGGLQDDLPLALAPGGGLSVSDETPVFITTEAIAISVSSGTSGMGEGEGKGEGKGEGAGESATIV
jgi:hypothetical protein